MEKFEEKLLQRNLRSKSSTPEVEDAEGKSSREASPASKESDDVTEEKVESVVRGEEGVLKLASGIVDKAIQHAVTAVATKDVNIPT